MTQYLRIFLVSVLLCCTVSAQTNATDRLAQVVQETQLVQTPAHDATALETLQKDQTITVKKRQQAWYQIHTDNDINGWVKMLSVRFLAAPKRDSETGLGSLWNSITSGKSDSTVSSGIRGFDEQDLRNAKANKDQVVLLATYRHTKEQAQAFARQGQLISNTLAANEEQ